jgi:hypothetical protein
LGAGLVGCEYPFDAGTFDVSLLLPSGDFADEVFWVVDSAIQTLTAEHADLDLDHVEPAGMLGGVMEFQASQNSPDFGERECLIEGASRVGRQVVVLYDPDARAIRIMDIDKLAHALGVVFCRPPLGDLDLAPRPMHIDADEEIDGAVAAILAVVTLELTRLGGDRLAHLADQLDRLSSKQTIGRLGSGASAYRAPLLCGRHIRHRPGECIIYPCART